MQTMQPLFKPSFFPISFLIIFSLLSLHPISSIATCNSDDLETLLEIKDYFGSDDSAFSTWDSFTDCCSWRGVGCSSSGHVISLVFKLKSVSDTQFEIPSIIRKLSNLVTLTLSNSKLTGSIPEVLAVLSNLQHLDLKGNTLSGSIPNFLGTLESLKFIDLSSNELSGGIPESLGSLSNLITLKLANNQLTGKIPDSLGSLTKLKKFNVSNNLLCGEIPSGLSGFSLDSFSNNACLCGDPLASCDELNRIRGGKFIKEVVLPFIG